MSPLINIKSPLAESLDALPADIAIRVQLIEANYRKAVERYRAVHEQIEREGSPLHDRVALFHPQGSMASGTTISLLQAGERRVRHRFDCDPRPTC